MLDIIARLLLSAGIMIGTAHMPAFLRTLPPAAPGAASELSLDAPGCRPAARTCLG